MDRKDFILQAASLFLLLRYFPAMASEGSGSALEIKKLADFVKNNSSLNPGNFKAIYADEKLRSEFAPFLKNVFNIYPDEKFHNLIAEITLKGQNDQEIYSEILKRIKEIKPLFSEFKYALPALKKQKKELATETMVLIPNIKKIDGYLEVGSTGRYVSELKKHIKMTGPMYLANVAEPTYGPVDVMERGQIFKLGKHLPLQNYDAFSKTEIAEGSLELVANYIGFHHCPLEKLEGFIKSLNRSLKAGGALVLRDHDVHDAHMNHVVALAHDIFNAGLKTTWDDNHKELRHFRPLEEWVKLLADFGFEKSSGPIYQQGDPTKNALVLFKKTKTV